MISPTLTKENLASKELDDISPLDGLNSIMSSPWSISSTGLVLFPVFNK